MKATTYEECISKGLELDQKINDIESQLQKKNVEYSIWGGVNSVYDMILFYYKIIALLIVLILVLILFFIIYSEYILYGTIASISLVLFIIVLYINSPSK